MDEAINTTGGQSWQRWFQGITSGLAEKWGDAQYVRPYEIRELEMTALGNRGYYREGQPMMQGAAGFGITPTMLLLGAVAVAAVLLLRK